MKLAAYLKYEYTKLKNNKLIVLFPFIILYLLYILYYGVSNGHPGEPLSYFVIHHAMTNLYSIIPFTLAYALAYLIYYYDLSHKYIIFLINGNRRMETIISKIVFTFIASLAVSAIIVGTGLIGGIFYNSLGSANVIALYFVTCIISILAEALLFGVFMSIFDKYMIIGLLLPFILYITTGTIFISVKLPSFLYYSIIHINILLANIYIPYYFTSGSENAMLQIAFSNTMKGTIKLHLTISELVLYSLVSLLLYILLLSIILIYIYKNKSL